MAEPAWNLEWSGANACILHPGLHCPLPEATFVRACSGSSLSIFSLPWTWELLLDVQVLLKEGNSMCVLPQGHPGRSEKGSIAEPRGPIPGAPLRLE